jgi:hypothetical protein
MFVKRQVFVKAVEGAKELPSGTLTSTTKAAQSHRDTETGVFGTRVGSITGVWVGGMLVGGMLVGVGGGARGDGVAVIPPCLVSASSVCAAAVYIGPRVAAVLGVPRPPQADMAMITVRLSTMKIFFRMNMAFLLQQSSYEIDALHAWGVPVFHCRFSSHLLRIKKGGQGQAQSGARQPKPLHYWIITRTREQFKSIIQHLAKDSTSHSRKQLA